MFARGKHNFFHGVLPAVFTVRTNIYFTCWRVIFSVNGSAAAEMRTVFVRRVCRSVPLCTRTLYKSAAAAAAHQWPCVPAACYSLPYRIRTFLTFAGSFASGTYGFDCSIVGNVRIRRQAMGGAKRSVKHVCACCLSPHNLAYCVAAPARTVPAAANGISC